MACPASVCCTSLSTPPALTPWLWSRGSVDAVQLFNCTACDFVLYNNCAAVRTSVSTQLLQKSCNGDRWGLPLHYGSHEDTVNSSAMLHWDLCTLRRPKGLKCTKFFHTRLSLCTKKIINMDMESALRKNLDSSACLHVLGIFGVVALANIFEVLMYACNAFAQLSSSHVNMGVPAAAAACTTG